MKPTSNLANPNFPTIPGTSVMPGISSLVHVLAKVEKGTPSPLRYGNRAQAEKKRESLAVRLTQEGLSSAVIRVESRFLIAVFPAGYDFDQKSGRLIERLEVRPSAGVRRRPPFATVSGSRINPRNRHNQGDGARHIIVSNAPSRLTLSIASNVSADPLRDEIRRRARLKHKLTGRM